MPELPEVEAAKRYLESEGLVGRRFTGADLRWPRAVRSGDVEDFVLGITGAAVRGLGRRGKFLLAELEAPGSGLSPSGGEGERARADRRAAAWLGIHLGMTGSVPIVEGAEPRHRFAHNVLALDDGRELRFVDPRKLGGLWLAGDVEEIAGGLGVEPLEPAFTVEALERLLAGRTAPVKPLLMDQRLIAGVGNIYADEALIRAGVSPLRPAKSLSAEDVAGVHAGLVEALELAVEPPDLAGHLREAPHGPRGDPRVLRHAPAGRRPLPPLWRPRRPLRHPRPQRLPLPRLPAVARPTARGLKHGRGREVLPLLPTGED